ncbi:unnamed protein product [Phyllotreta striolata]|uniref:Uncharacterized protein n=1 Tax=Phyllotreta striolata TaxID=444603 RepID=A0A9N9TIB7_PHYSR|nr:unnamed protein product [Phyllotreta striolata]
MGDENLFPSDDDNILSQVDVNLSDTLSSLSDAKINFTVFETKIRKCLPYMYTLDIAEIDNDFFRWLMPPLKDNLLKVFNNNVLLAELCANTEAIKDNLIKICKLLDVLKEVLSFLTEKPPVNVGSIKSIAITSIQIISETLDYLKKCSELEANFDEDIALQIFNLLNEVHCLYLQLMGSVLVSESENTDDIEILVQVLENIFDFSFLHNLNVKFLIRNWKCFIAILQKFAFIVKNRMDVKKQIKNLNSALSDNFAIILDSENSDVVNKYRIIKISEILVKVVLKIFQIWDDKIELLEEIVDFLCLFYSVQFKISTLEHQIVEQSNLIFILVKSFVVAFVQDEAFMQVTKDKNFLSSRCKDGLLNFLNTCLECLVVIDKLDNLELNILIRLVFDVVKECYSEFLLPENVFDDLVVNIAGSVLVYGEYKSIELILLENVLEEEFWNYFLAVEVWCLLLRNKRPDFTQQVLISLIDIFDQLEFGTLTYRLEKTQFRYFLHRVYRLLPDNFKCNVMQNTNDRMAVWKIMDGQHFPKNMKYFIDQLCQETLEKLNQLVKGDFSKEDFPLLVENLEFLSTVDFKKLRINSSKLADALVCVWTLTFSDIYNNNLFRYFIVKVFKITSVLFAEFNNKQLYMVLNKLLELSLIKHFKVPITFLLSSLCKLNLTCNNISKLISNILINLLRDSNVIVKQNVLEVLDLCHRNKQQTVVADVILEHENINDLINDYLNRRVNGPNFNFQYFKLLGEFKFKHCCVDWRVIEQEPSRKRFRQSEPENVTEAKQVKPLVEENGIKNRLQQFKYKKIDKPAMEENSENKFDESDNVNDVLCRMKGEVKCLVNVLKTDKLTPKNVADLKIIANQLSSFIN